MVLLAAGLIAWTDGVRQRHLDVVARLAGRAQPEDVLAASSPTGYAEGQRELIVADHNNDSYHWIMQTQQMLAEGEWRVRQVDYDNAPLGREVDAPSPYRWWLGLVATGIHVGTGLPAGVSVERAALYADPLLHWLFLATAAGFLAWEFGAFPAALFAVGLAALFPLAGAFSPGAPDDRGFLVVASVASLLPLLAGVTRLGRPEGDARAASRWFAAAGVLGGLALWVSVAAEAPVLAGVLVGALAAAAARKKSPANGSWRAAWIAWGLAGGVTVLVVSLIDYFPDHLGTWQVREVHPVYGVAWLGLAGVLVQLEDAILRGRPAWHTRSILFFTGALLALASLPAVMIITKNRGFLAPAVTSFRLSKLPGTVGAPNLWSWLAHEGASPTTVATLLPLVILVVAAVAILRSRGPAPGRIAAALAAGPVLLLLARACFQLTWWSLLDGLLLLLLVVLVTEAPGRTMTGVRRWIWTGAIGWMALWGAVLHWPSREAASPPTLNEAEIEGLVERDLAHWIARRTGGSGVVLVAPPKETTALIFYGGLRGLGTLAAENEDGIGAAIRLLSASTPEEARELTDRRGVTHFVIPSWDSFLDEYARIGMGQMEGTFLQRIHQWRTPPWLRPVAYPFPSIPGFEQQSVEILEVVEDQEDAVALSRTAEYFVDMNQLEQAALVAQALRKFPADPGALTARAEVESARGERDAFRATLELLKPRLTGQLAENLPWDRRVALAIVLARGEQMDLARAQVKRCLAGVDATRLRQLSTNSLYGFLVLLKGFDLKMADPALERLARDLLPADARSRF